MFTRGKGTDEGGREVEGERGEGGRERENFSVLKSERKRALEWRPCR